MVFYSFIKQIKSEERLNKNYNKKILKWTKKIG